MIIDIELNKQYIFKKTRFVETNSNYILLPPDTKFVIKEKNKKLKCQVIEFKEEFKNIGIKEDTIFFIEEETFRLFAKEVL